MTATSVFSPGPFKSALIVFVLVSGALLMAGWTQKFFASTQSAPIQLGSEIVTVSIDLKGKSGLITSRAAKGNAAVVLTVEGIEYDKQPGIYYEVYLNLPKGAADPDPERPSFIGTLTFFGLKEGAAEGGAKPKQDYLINEAVRGLIANRLWNPAELKVTFVPRGVISPEGHKLPIRSGAEAKIAKVSISGE